MEKVRKMNGKQVININESQLKKIITEAVQRVLNYKMIKENKTFFLDTLKRTEPTGSDSGEAMLENLFNTLDKYGWGSDWCYKTESGYLFRLRRITEFGWERDYTCSAGNLKRNIRRNVINGNLFSFVDIKDRFSDTNYMGCLIPYELFY